MRENSVLPEKVTALIKGFIDIIVLRTHAYKPFNKLYKSIFITLKVYYEF